MKSGVPGIYLRRLSVTPGDVASHRRLLNYLKRYFFRFSPSLNFSPGTRYILDSIPKLSFVPCFFLAYTLCRINEIDQIKIVDLKKRKPFQICSSKSDHTREVPPLLPFKLPQLASLINTTPLLVISYDSLCNSIKTARIRGNIVVPDNALSSTHIFRHLEATWLHSQKVDLDFISYKLGHKSRQTTLTYIHDKG